MESGRAIFVERVFIQLRHVIFALREMRDAATLSIVLSASEKNEIKPESYHKSHKRQA